MESSKFKILVVDDDADLRELIVFTLENAKDNNGNQLYKVLEAANGLEAISQFKAETPNLILMDMMMDEMDGVEACMEIRKLPNGNDTIISFLSARTEDFSHNAGIDAGADNYIEKPVKPLTLLKKVEALLRRLRLNGSPENTTHIGDIKIDLDKYLVYIKGVEISLPKKEFELLALLISKPGVVFTRDIILSKVWGSEVVVGDRTIDVHIRKLREKLGDKYIKTVKGVGYKIEA
jgi:two-component system alkaline phosphatase synthesis response regulator PhoP